MSNNLAENAEQSPAGTAPLPVSSETTSRKVATESRVAEISQLLGALEEAASESGLSARSENTKEAGPRHENKLTQVRLGIANSLFTALKHKHAPTAEHSLRVALGCSGWAAHAKLDEESRNTVELAALMHDIGKIGLPDGVLMKPSRLNSEEMVTFSQHRQIGLDIMTDCCSNERLLRAIEYAGARYDGLHSDLPLQGKDIPLESRMIMIVNAFDSMTTDQIHRRAKSREKALNELFEYAGKQFDPELVKEFVDALSQRQDLLSSQVAAPLAIGFEQPWL